MNVLGHIHVALAGGRDDPEYLLGAVLPDLAPMAGVRLRARSGLPGAVGEGVRCHLRADRAFHAHAGFRDGAAALRRAVAAAGVASGPSRAVGHAGWELLLDGTLVGTEVERAFHGAVRMAGEVADALAPADRARWAAFLARAPARRPPTLRRAPLGGRPAARDAGAPAPAPPARAPGGHRRRCARRSGRRRRRGGAGRPG